MKANVVVAERRVDQTGQDMLAGMLLHIRKPLVPVDLTAHLGARRNLVLDHMADDILLVDLRIAHRNALLTNKQTADIRGLTTLLREKAGLIQNDRKALLDRLTGKHGRGKAGAVGVLVK